MEMFLEDRCPQKYPEWYLLERETEKTINKLSRVEELKFYLRSPDRYYRRLAILRVNQLNLKDAVSYLEEILDNTTESQLNKNLAAWTIKSICLKCNLELFISNKLFYQFSGREDYHEMYKIFIEDTFAPLQVKIPSSTASERFHLENDAARLDRDLSFQASFSLTAWLKTFLGEWAATAKERLLNFPLAIFKRIKNLKKSNLKMGGRHDKKLFSLIFLKPNVKGMSKINFRLLSGINSHLPPGFGSLFHRVLRHKFLLGATFCVLYYYFTFSDTGITLTKGRFGISFIEAQNNFLKTDLMETRDEILITAKKILSIAWVQIKDIGDWLYCKWIQEIGVK